MVISSTVRSDFLRRTAADGFSGFLSLSKYLTNLVPMLCWVRKGIEENVLIFAILFVSMV